MVSLEQFEELRLKLVAYESQQAVGQAEMKAEVKDQVSEVTDGLKELYNTASVAVGTVAARVEQIEEKIRGGAMQGQKSLLHHKNMTVSVLEKMDLKACHAHVIMMQQTLLPLHCTAADLLFEFVNS